MEGIRGRGVQVNVSKDLLQKVFDVAVGSMNFTSGFLDDEEVSALRELAVILDVDPMTATPENFMCKYEGKHGEIWTQFGRTTCLRCRQSV